MTTRARGPKLWAWAGLWLDPYHPAPLIEGPQPRPLQSRPRPGAEPRKKACFRKSWRKKSLHVNAA